MQIFVQPQFNVFSDLSPPPVHIVREDGDLLLVTFCDIKPVVDNFEPVLNLSKVQTYLKLTESTKRMKVMTIPQQLTTIRR